MSTARPAIIATTRSISSYLDGDHSPNDEVADEYHENADRDQHPPDEVLEHRAEIGWRHEVHEHRQHDRQERDQSAGGPCLCCQGRDLALDPDPLTNRVRDVVQDLRQVSTDRPVDRVRGGDEVEVGAGDTLGDVLKSLVW